MKRITIAIIGSGAVGGYYGARLAQHGHDVHFLLRSDFAAVKKDGWMVKSVDGDFVLHPNQFTAHEDVSTMPQADLIIIALKATANDVLPKLLPPLVKESTAVLTLQNGLGNEDVVANIVGADRVLGGLAFVCINRVGAGKVHHSDHGLIKVGDFARTTMDRPNWIEQMFGAANIACRAIDDLKKARWEKLVWNVPFNGLGTAMLMTTDQLIGSNAGLELVRGLMQEIITTAATQGITFPADLIEQKIDHTRTMGAYKTSMQVDRETGRPIELDAIFLQPRKVAQSSNVLTKHLDWVIKQLTIVQEATSK